MQHTIHTVRSYRELLAAGVEAGPYDFEALFGRLPGRAERAARERLERLRALDPFIRPMLAAGESVRFVTFGERTSPLVSALLGSVPSFTNRVGLAVTDRRLLVTGLDDRDRPGPTRLQLRSTAVASVTGLPLGGVRVGLRGGGAFWLASIPKSDREGLVANLERFVPRRGRRARRAEVRSGPERLCGTCGRILGSVDDPCNACREAEQRIGRAVLLALFVPGAGLLHMGHRLPALAQFLKGLVLLCLLVLLVLNSGPWLAALVFVAWYATMSVGEWLLVRSHSALSRDATRTCRGHPARRQALDSPPGGSLRSSGPPSASEG